MLQTILENPIWVGFWGTCFAVVLLWVWLQTSYKTPLYLALAAILFTVVACAIGVSIKTDREVLEDWLTESALLLQNNEFERLAERVHPGASPDLRSLQVRAEGLEFVTVAIKHIHDIQVTGKEPNKRAIIKFNVFAELQFAGNIQKFPRYVELTLYNVEGKWLVSEVRHEEPTYGFKTHDE